MDLAYSFAHDSDLDLNLNLNLNLNRVPDRSRALDRALDRVRDLDRDLDLALDRALVRDRGRRLDFDRAPRARDFDSTRIRPDDDGFIHIHTRDRVFARALGLGLGSHYWELLPALIDACGVILDTWTAVLAQPQTMFVRIERSIEGFLAAVVAQSADAMTHPTEDPARALHQISERLRNDPDSEADVLALVEHAYRLVDMYLDQRVSVATQVAIVASACLVAALALLYTRSEGDDLAKQIAHVLGTLVVLADPGNGPTPNEVLLLVRDS